MPSDFGRQVVTAAGTAEPLTNDLDAASAILDRSVVTAITFHAPLSNIGNVFIGRLERDNSTSVPVSSTYGFTLAPGDSLSMSNMTERFNHFEVDAATSGDVVEWAAVFQPGAQG